MTRRELRDLALRGRPRGSGAGPAAAPGGRRGGGHQEQRRRRGHRGRPRQRGADPWRLLSARRPEDGFLGEEGSDRAGTSGVRWIVDPIDGTVNFLYGLPQYAVSDRGRAGRRPWWPGWSLNAATGVEYAAALGGGATRDGVPLRVRGPAPLHQRLVAHRVRLRLRPAGGPGRRDGTAAAAGPRHPPARLVRPGPVPRR